MNDRLFQAHWLLAHRGAYDAFILGSSRSKMFSTRTWTRHLPRGARPFHMGVNDESLYGIDAKIAFLEREGFATRWILLALDHRILSRTSNPEPHIFREAPVVSGEHALQFYKRFVIAFLDPRFLHAWAVWWATGQAPPGSETLLWTSDVEYVRPTGDHVYAGMEAELARDPSGYYARRAEVFRRPRRSPAVPVVGDEARPLLARVAAAFGQRRTDVRVVVTPNFDQVPLHAADLRSLQDAFGRDRVWDFSGVNELTRDIRNYYEERHFRPEVAAWVLDRVYGEPGSQAP